MDEPRPCMDHCTKTNTHTHTRLSTHPEKPLSQRCDLPSRLPFHTRAVARIEIHTGSWEQSHPSQGWGGREGGREWGREGGRASVLQSLCSPQANPCCLMRSTNHKAPLVFPQHEQRSILIKISKALVIMRDIWLYCLGRGPGSVVWMVCALTFVDACAFCVKSLM